MERAGEQEALEDELRKRRERVKAWQAAKGTSTVKLDQKSSTAANGTEQPVSTNIAKNSEAIIVSKINEPKYSVNNDERNENDGIDDDNEEKEEEKEEVPKWTLEDEDEVENDEDDLIEHHKVNTNKDYNGSGNDDYLSYPLLTESNDISTIQGVGTVEHKINEDDDEEETAVVFSSAASRLKKSKQLKVGSSKTAATTATTIIGSASSLTSLEPSMKIETLITREKMISTPPPPVLTIPSLQIPAQQQPLQQPKHQVSVQLEEEEDPLDAFMKSLYTTSEDLEKEDASSSSSSNNTTIPTTLSGPATANAATISKKLITTNALSSSSSALGLSGSSGSSSSNNMNAYRIDPFGSNFITMEDLIKMGNNNNNEYDDSNSSNHDESDYEYENISNNGMDKLMNGDTTATTNNNNNNNNNTLKRKKNKSSQKERTKKVNEVIFRAGWESDLPSSPGHSTDHDDDNYDKKRLKTNNSNATATATGIAPTSSMLSAASMAAAQAQKLIDDEEEREERERREFIQALRQASATSNSTIGVSVLAKSNLLAAAAAAAASSSTMNTASIGSSTIIDVNITKDTTTASSSSSSSMGRIFAGEGDMIDESEVEDKKKSALEVLDEAKKGKELKPVDHSSIEYIAIRKNLYIVPKSLAKLTEQQIKEKRDDLQIKVRGRQCPAPVDTWAQCGLSERTLQVIQKQNLEAPFAIQKQAIPAIMCGRDIIAIAKTGSGKTLAFLLPMFRHIQDQPPLKPSIPGEGGPIGLILAPARELALQIAREAKKFATAIGLSVACIYGGAGVADQIGELKRGADIVVCTPGRMIDILCMQAGKLVSLRRVSFVVMDEADRMFDMGFEPQMRMILQNVRPDRQTVLFSATFPKQIEKLAKYILKTPLEIIVGERSSVNKDITQIVEVHDDDDKFMRLLQLLGVWYEKGSVLIFVDKQEKCDSLFHDLLKSGYPCLSLHGGQDQADRDHTLHEFRNQIKSVLVATSAVSRGLDVPEIIVVINYNCPNHLEEYVHRVGRTGRAGRKGTAYTFISPQEEQYSPIMVKALEKAEQAVPQELLTMANAFKEKVARGEAQWCHSGFGGEGFTFDASEMNESQKAASMQKRQYEIDQGIAQDKDEAGGDYLQLMDEDDDMMILPQSSVVNSNSNNSSSSSGTIRSSSSSSITAAAAAQSIASTTPSIIEPGTPAYLALSPFEKAQMMARIIAAKNSLVPPITTASPSLSQSTTSTGTIIDPQSALARARQIAMQMGNTSGSSSSSSRGTALMPTEGSAMSATAAQLQSQFTGEIEINDYPPQARRKVTQKSSMDEITDRCGVTVISRGSFIPPGKKVDPLSGERKLYLLIEGPSEMQIKFARMEILRALEEETMKIGASAAGGGGSGRYSVT